MEAEFKLLAENKTGMGWINGGRNIENKDISCSNHSHPQTLTGLHLLEDEVRPQFPSPPMSFTISRSGPNQAVEPGGFSSKRQGQVMSLVP